MSWRPGCFQLVPVLRCRRRTSVAGARCVVAIFIAPAYRMHTSGCAQHPCAPALVRARGCAVRASALVSPWHPWRRERPSERAAKLVTHASAGEEEESPALRFFKGLQGGLPVIGLVRSARKRAGRCTQPYPQR